MEVPNEAAIAVRSRTQQLADKAEQQQLKKLVLQSEERQLYEIEAQNKKSKWASLFLSGRF